MHPMKCYLRKDTAALGDIDEIFDWPQIYEDITIWYVI